MEDVNGKKMKEKRWVKLEKPKHPECYSLEECAAFQPWRVDLKVENDVGGEEPVILTYTVFLRAPSVHDAQYTAYQCFIIWERLRPGIEDWEEYPKICTSIPSEAEKLTEEQYKEYWKEAQYYPNTFTGMRDNPTIFRFAKPGWQYPENSLIKPKAPKIIVPDKSAIDKVNKSKNKK